jgi:hypothetical protein
MAFIKKIIVLTPLLLLACCARQKAVKCEMPSEMLPHVKQHYTAESEKGQKLYDINCGNCHTTYAKRKKIVPDFTPDQLKGYELRLTNKKHQSVLTDSLVTEEELATIMIFLKYKVKN